MKYRSSKTWLGDNSDNAWEWFGKNDPYYGVLSGTEYRKNNLSAETLEQFFETGHAHVDRVLNIASTHFGAVRMESCLDFGCGVGRLVVPFASRFKKVVGVDVSPSMIKEAADNCERFGIGNAQFARTLTDVSDSFDLVHSYIVLQHMPVSKGFAAMDTLIRKTKPGGQCFIHFSIGRNAGFARRLATFGRKNIKPVHYALNVLEGKKINEAYMQSNDYSLNRCTAWLYDRGIRQLWIESENHAGPYSVSIAFRVP
jgi:ubiquinone/menaquinone biosynthesis C-methylase UbiE